MGKSGVKMIRRHNNTQDEDRTENHGCTHSLEVGGELCNDVCVCVSVLDISRVVFVVGTVVMYRGGKNEEEKRKEEKKLQKNKEPRH